MAEKMELDSFLFQNFPDRCECLSFLLDLWWIILVKENTFSVAVHFFLPPCRAENQVLHLLFQEKYHHRPGVCIRGWLGSECLDTAEFWGPSRQMTTPFWWLIPQVIGHYSLRILPEFQKSGYYFCVNVFQDITVFPVNFLEFGCFDWVPLSTQKRHFSLTLSLAALLYRSSMVLRSVTSPS